MRVIKQITVAIICMQLLSGCLAVGVGAATALGGYMAGNFINKKRRGVDEDRHAARTNHLIQQTKLNNDQKIKAAINGALLKNVSAGSMSVETTVQQGAVTLFGTVANPQTADKIIDIVRRTKGVQKVIPRLNVLAMNGAAGGAMMPPPSPYQQQPMQPQAMPQPQPQPHAPNNPMIQSGPIPPLGAPPSMPSNPGQMAGVPANPYGYARQAPPPTRGAPQPNPYAPQGYNIPGAPSYYNPSGLGMMPPK